MFESVLVSDGVCQCVVIQVLYLVQILIFFQRFIEDKEGIFFLKSWSCFPVLFLTQYTFKAYLKSTKLLSTLLQNFIIYKVFHLLGTFFKYWLQSLIWIFLQLFKGFKLLFLHFFFFCFFLILAFFFVSILTFEFVLMYDICSIKYVLILPKHEILSKQKLVISNTQIHFSAPKNQSNLPWNILSPLNIKLEE